MISFLCPKCRTRFDRADTEAEKRIVCRCGQMLIVPKIEALMGLPIDHYDEEYEDEEDDGPQEVVVTFGRFGPEEWFKMAVIYTGVFVFVFFTCVCCGVMKKLGVE